MNDQPRKPWTLPDAPAGVEAGESQDETEG